MGEGGERDKSETRRGVFTPLAKDFIFMDFFNVEHMSVSFGGLKALDAISFDVRDREIFSIIGPNGAGKTTLFNCINGIYHPDTGSILFKGKNIRGKKPDEIARMKIARTFQNIELFDHLSAMENIMLGRHIHMKTGILSGALMWGRGSWAGREEMLHRRRAEEIIDFMDLQSTRNRLAGSLPYGVRKQVELARALAVEPQLLLLDEPCAGMNSEEKQDMIFKIMDIRDELGVAILLIEHDMKMVMDISDRILAINFGRGIARGVPEEIQENPEVLKAYLGE